MGKQKTQARSIDVARLAGVSRSAVSRSYTPGAYVSDETRRKVLEAAEALGYHPNALARSLITRRTGIIGIVSTDLDNPFYAALLQALSMRFQAEGLAPLLLFGDETSTDRQITQLLSYQVDALVMTNATLSSAMAARFARIDKPVVAINRYMAQEEITSITSDNHEAAGQVADHFVSLGCRRIAFLAGKPDASSSRDREAGFMRRLAQLGHPLIAHDVGNYHHLGGVEAARRLLRREVRPDAIFCANDLMAFGVMDVARGEFGLRIPQDLKVCGFDNSGMASWPAYDLTTVDQGMETMVETTVQHIRDCLAGQLPSTRHLEVAGRVIIRGSTDERVCAGLCD